MVGDGASSKQDLEAAEELANAATGFQRMSSLREVHGGRAAGDRKWTRPFIEENMLFAGNCAKLCELGC